MTPPPTAATLMLLMGEPVIAALTAFRLQLLGFETLLPADSHAAAALMIKQRISAILIDTKIADGEGLAFLAKLRRQHPPADLPAMVISLDPSLDTVRMAYQNGAQDYLIAPYDPTILESKVSRLLSHLPNGAPHATAR